MTGIIRDKNQIIVTNVPSFDGDEETRFKITIDGQDRLVIDTFDRSGTTGKPSSAYGKITLFGDFEVDGEMTSVNQNNLLIEDRTITLNRNEEDAGVSDGTGLSGIEVERGTETNTSWLFDEANLWWGPYGAAASASGPTKTLGNINEIDTTTAGSVLVVTATGAVQVAAGTTGERPGSPADGMVRFNTSLNAYEGYGNGGWVGLGGVVDADQDTRIIAEYPTPGSDDDILHFLVGDGSTAGGVEGVKIGFSYLEMQTNFEFRAWSGTVTTPGITFNGNTDTGLYMPASTTIGISTNGVARVLVKDDEFQVVTAAQFDSTVDVTGITTLDEAVIATLEVTTAAEFGADIDMDGNDITESGNILPALDNTYDLGSSDLKWNEIYGVSTTAAYADLAERYAADAVYDAGTVLVFGGEHEVTVSSIFMDTRVAGVVSANPAFKMNSDAGDDATHPYVALKGRVPCKVVGRIKKGDLLVTSEIHGVATVDFDPAIGSIIGKSLQDYDSEVVGLIEIVVL